MRKCLILAAAALAACADPAPPAPVHQGRVPPSLAAHTAEFEHALIEVTPGVHVAVGYALANAILIEGEDGIIVIDTTESVETAREILTDYRAQISAKPVAAIIYTHNHVDHVFGAAGFAPAGGVPVYAHATTEREIDAVVNLIRPVIAARAARMFGDHLPEGEHGFVNSGIGPFLAVGARGRGGTAGVLRPTHIFEDEMETTIAGVRMRLVHAPGETDDQIFVFLPDLGVLMPGDNIYRAFPNLYTIRGTTRRDVRAWAASLDRMRALGAEHLVPSHTRPVSGREAVSETLTVYRDAIQYVHDQTVRWMNAGLTADEIALRVRLPDGVRDHPFLLEHYGTVEWSVRAVFDGYLGWFDGDASTLQPAPAGVRAERIIALAGGLEPAIAALEAAVEAEDWRWAAELGGHLRRHAPGEARVRVALAASFRALGYASVSPNGRNYYLTQALEAEGALDVWSVPPDIRNLDLLKTLPVRNFLEAMAVRLRAEETAGLERVIGFRFTDTGEAFTLTLRNGIAQLSDGFPPSPDAALETTTAVWIEIAAGVRGLPAALASGDASVPTGALSVPGLVATLRLFRAD